MQEKLENGIFLHSSTSKNYNHRKHCTQKYGIHIINGQLGEIQEGNLYPDRSRDKLSNLQKF